MARLGGQVTIRTVTPAEAAGGCPIAACHISPEPHCASSGHWKETLPPTLPLQHEEPTC